jgi:hypothetical protein
MLTSYSEFLAFSIISTEVANPSKLSMKVEIHLVHTAVHVDLLP